MPLAWALRGSDPTPPLRAGAWPAETAPQTRSNRSSSRDGGAEKTCADSLLPSLLPMQRQALQLRSTCPSRTAEVSALPLDQAGSWRVRKKRKNSTPSRRRRFIISGLAIISARIDAILLGRK